MRLTPIIALAALSPLLASAKGTFSISLKRYGKEGCEGKAISKPETLHGDGECHNFKDKKASSSFDHEAGGKGKGKGDDPEKYGECTLQLYVKEGCKGEAAVNATEVSSYSPKIDRCNEVFADMRTDQLSRDVRPLRRLASKGQEDEERQVDLPQVLEQDRELRLDSGTGPLGRLLHNVCSSTQL
jgi:hypothetical protein